MTTRIRRGRAVLWVIPLLWAFVFGGCKCGPGTTSAPDGQNLGPLLDVLGAMCSYLTRCPDSSPYPIAYRSQTECVDILEFLVSCHLTDTRDGSGNDVIGVQQSYPNVDAQQAQACVDWLNQAACGAPFDASSDGGSSPCSFLGGGSSSSGSSTPPAGLDQSCASAQCAPGYYCESPKQVDGGTTCQVCKPLRGLGGDCVDPPYVNCGPGLFCPSDGGGCEAVFGSGVSCNWEGQCDSGFCNPRTTQCDPGGNAGDACTTAQDCRQGFCDGTGHCQNLLANGTACSASTQCQASYCDTGTQKCGKPDGVACSGSSECQGYCDTNNGYVCAAKLADGSSCQSGDQCQSGWCDIFGTQTCYSGGCHSNADCPAGQFCNNSSERCQAPGGTGAACESDDQCQSGHCSLSSQTCGPKPALGSSCGNTADCIPVGYCANGVCTAFLKPDQACTDIESCAPPFVCLKGKCTLMPLTCAPAPQNSTCTYLQVCDQTSYCDPLNNFTCEARAAAGASCSRPGECQVGLYCDLSQGKCAPAGQAGASCGFEKPCAPGLFCDSSSSQCTGPKPAGASCSPSSPQECESGACAYTSGSGYTCVAACIPVPPGEVPACHPITCPSNLNCGSVDDGCGGQAYCGACTGFDTCGGAGTPNLCGCTPTTSACLPRQCDTAVDNGCGTKITCPSTCPQYQTCGGGGGSLVCGCPTDAVTAPALPDGGGDLPNTANGGSAWQDVNQVGSMTNSADVFLVTPGGYSYSDFLVASGFGFQLPPGAVINRIDVTARASASCPNSSCYGVSLDQAELLFGGKVLGTSSSLYSPVHEGWATAAVTPSDPLWGYPWLPAQLNSPDFSVAISVKTYQEAWVYLDDVQVTVSYAVSCCQSTCQPGQTCGSDGCGGQCGGGCRTGQTCVNNFSCEWLPWTDPSSGLTWLNQQVETVYSCSDFADAGGFNDWHWPTIDQLRTLVRGCPGTQSDGGCGVTDVCDDVSCEGSACGACSVYGGPGPNGTYLPPEVTPAYEFLGSATPVLGAADAGTWFINFDTGQVSTSCNPNGCDLQSTCVRP